MPASDAGPSSVQHVETPLSGGGSPAETSRFASSPPLATVISAQSATPEMSWGPEAEGVSPQPVQTTRMAADHTEPRAFARIETMPRQDAPRADISVSAENAPSKSGQAFEKDAVLGPDFAPLPASRPVQEAAAFFLSANTPSFAPSSSQADQTSRGQFTPARDTPVPVNAVGGPQQEPFAPRTSGPLEETKALATVENDTAIAHPAPEWGAARSPRAEQNPLPAGEQPSPAEMAFVTRPERALAGEKNLAESAGFDGQPEAMAIAAGTEILTAQLSPTGRGIEAQSANVARQVVQQLAENALTPNGKVEISLNPEELGRVRLTASQTDQGVVLIVQAERPETLDLMRRHLPDLMQDLKNMGFGDVSYSDQQQQQNQERAGTAIRADAAPIEDPETQMVQATGLDLRL